MKKLLLLLIGLAMLISVNAQKDSLITKDQAQKKLLELSLESADRWIAAGGTMVIGGFTMGIMCMVVSSIPHESAPVEVIGAASFLTGLIGIPIWISGVNQRNNVQIQLIRFEYTASVGIGFKIRF